MAWFLAQLAREIHLEVVVVVRVGKEGSSIHEMFNREKVKDERQKDLDRDKMSARVEEGFR